MSVHDEGSNSMESHVFPSKRASARKAFTLIELLVVISIIAILAALLLPALAKGKTRAKRVACASNEHQMALAIQMYSGENQGRLPASDADNSDWPWDIPSRLIDELVVNGMQRHVLYCPAGREQDNELLWSQYYAWGCATIGYGWITPHGTPWSRTRLFGRDIQTKATVVTGTNTTSLVETEVIVDAVVSQHPGAQLSFTRIVAGGEHRTSHLNGARPEGGNILFLDGHVDWRKFADMKVRFRDPNWDVVQFWW
jgi:prepilin-type N-terminal cleavage/methylation domain-containing protein/prepilin-type processing-associated H-X9-DG protein